MRALIVGCGYVGLPLGAELAKLGHEVFGLRRSAAADHELLAAGIAPLHADITRPESLAGLPRDFAWVVNCAASGGGDEQAYRQLYLQGTRNLIGWLSAPPLQKFVHTGSTGVYAQNDGSLVDESSPTDPAAATAQVLVETERTLLAVARDKNFPAVVLRAAGIYGPDRAYLLKQFLRGETRIEGDGRWLNMIHRDDLIQIIIAALARGRAGGIYNAVDDEPVGQRPFFEWLAARLGRPLPLAMPANAAPNRARGLTNKRVSNRRLKAELGVRLKFPTFREGYTAEIQRLAAGGE